MKLLKKGFHLSGSTMVFHPQTPELEDAINLGVEIQI